MEDDSHPNRHDPNWGEEICGKCWLLLIIGLPLALHLIWH